MKKHVIYSWSILLMICLTALSCTQKSKTIHDTAITENVVYAPITELEMAEKNKPTSNFIFDVGSRFNTIKKEDVLKLKSFNDVIGQAHIDRIVSYQSLSVILLKDSEQTDTKITTQSGILSEDQLQLLKTFDYSTNLILWAEYMERNIETGVVEAQSWTPYLTIVPETEALYNDDNKSILDYVEKNSKEDTADLKQDSIQSGRIVFTVTKNGFVSNVEVEASSGFKNIDKKIKELISNLPGKWQPAKNGHGENVDQSLVLFFGRMGC